MNVESMPNPFDFGVSCGGCNAEMPGNSHFPHNPAAVPPGAMMHVVVNPKVGFVDRFCDRHREMAFEMARAQSGGADWNGGHDRVMFRDNGHRRTVSVGVVEGKDCWWMHRTVVNTAASREVVEAWVNARTPEQMVSEHNACGKVWVPMG